jgi:hypothetical protein
VSFERERAAYARVKEELLATAEAEYVVFVGDEMIGPFSSEDDAERAGYMTFGLGPLYIKRIVAQERVVVLPPGVTPCRS